MDNSNSVRRGNAGRDKSAVARAEDGRTPPVLTAPREPAKLDSRDDRNAAPPVRVAIMDSDSGFLAVLSNRLERLDWEH
jgi:hypothetical protein